MRFAGLVAFVIVAFAPGGDGRAKEPGKTAFDPAVTGSISGTVRWAGPLPEVPPIIVDPSLPGFPKVPVIKYVNPHAPVIGADSSFAGAVLMLRGVDPNHAKPWDHPAVTVEVQNQRAIIRQGDANHLVGFVRRGDTITMVSKEAGFRSLRARGADFFTYTLPDPDRPRQRVMKEKGRVSFSSASGQLATHGHLFVDDHPYYTLSDAQGRFSLTQVPAGKYELVCWRPDWRIERIEHDPETLLNVRLYFQPPIETVSTVEVKVGEVANANFELK